jgi:hypothetical protein
MDLLLCSLFVQASVRRGANLVVTPDRSVDDAGRGEAVATQRRQEREGSPSPEGRFGDEAFASGASAMGARHVGLGPGLVDEDKPPRIDPRLTRLPPFTPPGDVRSVLFGGAKTFF